MDFDFGIADDQEFERRIHCATKDDENRFIIKYHLSKTERMQSSEKIIQETTKQQNRDTPKKQSPMKKQRKKKQQSKQKYQPPKQKKAHYQLYDWDDIQINEYKKYNKINHKQIKFLKDIYDDSENPRLKKKERKQKKRQEKRQQRRNKKLEKYMELEEGLEDIYETGLFKDQRHRSIDYEPKTKSLEKRNFKKIQKKKKNSFQPYLSLDEIEESRQRGEKKYFKGIADFNERIKWFGKILSKEKQGQLVIEHHNRNRALHEDEVYFEVLSQKHENSERIQCKVVAILPWKKNQIRQVVGKIQYSDRNKTYYLVPINKRIISFNININQIKRKQLKNRNNKYFLAECTGWDEDEEYPHCRIIEEYGKLGQIQTQIGALLVTHGVHDEEYKEDLVQTGLKKFIDRIDHTGEYQIENSQLARRKDLRTHDIFTIDPLTARDFDDALSIDEVENRQGKKVYQVGVHIADASFFVEEGSLIDEEAKKKTTSVYLMHRVLPMLPRILCETMCSLNPGLQRLTLSIWFRVTEDGEILDGSRYDRSVIKSKARFTYEQAQQIIDKKVNSQNEIDKGFGCIEADDFDKVAQDIRIMNDIAQKIRLNRIRDGSLIIETMRKTFKLDDKMYPIDYYIKERFAANFLVQEYMLLANRKIGQILVENMGECSLLRKHKFPGNKKIQKFEAFTKKINQNIKVTKDIKIQEKLNEIMKDPKVKKCIKDILNYELISLLEMAQYFLVGDSSKQEWLHYALNMPIYTHFTSPIRRYPDIIVHRQICAILEAKKTKNKIIKPTYDKFNELIGRCNRNKISAKKVSTGCQKIFFCLYLKNNPITCKAVLTGVNEWGFNISIPDYDFRNTIEIKQLTKMKMIKYAQDAKERKFMEVECEYEEGQFMKIILKEMQEVTVRISAKQGFPIDYLLRLAFPNPKNPANMIVYG